MPRRAKNPRPRPDRRKPAPIEIQRKVKVAHIPPDQLEIMRERLARLGLRGMTDFYRGEHWRKVRDWWANEPKMIRACWVCGDWRYELHHRTYVRLGCERPTDLVPLCRKHHEAAHELITLREPGVTLWNAHTRLERCVTADELSVLSPGPARDADGVLWGHAKAA